MKRFAYFIPALLWAALTFYLSSRSTTPDIIGEIPFGDKIVHATYYGIFTLWVLYGARWPDNRMAWWCVLPVSLYGMTDEYHQSFVPGRSSDWRDWVADTTGAVLCVLIWRYISQKKRSAP